MPFNSMEQNYKEARFRIEMPAGGLPPRFCIVTSCNPGGCLQSVETNQQATEELQMELEIGKLPFFLVTGGAADLSHFEEGFGIVLTNRGDAIALGRRWKQDAVFWVERGEVELLSCASDERAHLGLLEDLLLNDS